MVTPPIMCRGLTKRYAETVAIDAVDLEVAQGSVVGYLGPNGAGKTTTLRILLGLARPSSGTGLLFGVDARAEPEVRRRIGYLPGELRLDPRLSVGETLETWARIRGGVEPAYRGKLLERFELDPTRQTRSLSTGNRRKVGLVGALMARPDLLILDEPTSGLDPLMRETFLETVAEARADGRTVLLSSHVIAEVERVADTVAVLRSGRLAAHRPVAELGARPAHQLRVRTGDAEATAAICRELRGSPHAGEMTGAGPVLSMSWSGPLGPLLGVLARHDVSGLTASEGDLTGEFLSYFQEER